MKRKLVAVLACRNNGSRLYGKPLQNLGNDPDINIISMIINTLKKSKSISVIILAISNKKDNVIYQEIAKNNKIKFIFGPDEDVLKRLNLGAKATNASDIFRVTTESPFISFEYIDKIWKMHIKEDNDLTIFSNNIDGMGFEIFTSDSLLISHKKGNSRHRSELCDLYIRENNKDFKVKYFLNNKYNKNYRLTVDNPEDLILCKKLFIKYQKDYPLISMKKIIKFLNNSKKDVKLTKKFMSSSKSINNLWSNAKKI